MPQPPTLYRPITTAPDELGLTQKSIDRERLARDEEDARKARQAALDAHLSGFADDPVSKALATADFVLQEEESQKAKAQKEYDDVVSKYDDPVMKAWAVAEHYAKQSDAPEAQKAFADRNRLEMLRERDKNAATLDRAGNYGMGVADAFVRETIGSAVNVVPDLASVVARLKGEADVANQLNRESQQFGEARDQVRSDDMSPWLSRMYGGASQSLMQTAATPGGGAAKAIGVGVTAGNQALTTAEDAGLEGAAKYRYAGSQAAFETGVALLGQKFFGGGIESRLAGQTVAAQTWKALAKNIGTDALKEMPEEVVTSILQDVSSKLEGVSPDMNFADFVTNATEAAVQAAMMAPMANAGNAAALAFRQKPSKQNYDAAVSAGMPPIDNPNREGRTKYAADLEAAAQKQPAPEPTTKEGVSIETPSEATPEQATLEPTAPAANPDNAPDTEYDEILNLLQKGDPNEAKDQTGQAPEASAEGQGQAEGLLTKPPAETQEQPTPADSQENRESPAAQNTAEASPVATGEPSPDQSQPLTEAGPVSLPEYGSIEKGDDGLFYPSLNVPGKLPNSSFSGFKTEQEAKDWFTQKPTSNTSRSFPPPKGSIGFNTSGQPIYESKTGVRTVGQEQEVPFNLKYTKGEGQKAVFKTPRQDQFKTEAELAAEKAHAATRHESAIKKYPARIPHPDVPGREVDAPPVYLTGVSNAQSREAAKTTPNLGVMITPRTQQYRTHLKDYQFFGVDNGAFTQKFNEKGFYKLLDNIREQGDAGKALFATAPDVVGDWEATLKASEPHLDRIRDAGFPVAIVLQNGATVETIPWDRIDALFVGGTVDNNFKLAQKADGNIDTKAEMLPIIKEARRRDVPIHYGRVNSAKRLETTHFGMGGRSVDGTFIKFGNADAQTEKVMKWLKPWGTFPDAKTATPAAKPKPKAAAKPVSPANPNSLRSIVLAQGGISTKALRKDYNLNELKANGLLGIMRIQGLPVDIMAQTLESSGDLRTPADRTPADWLMDQLQSNADGARATYSDEEIGKRLEAEREAYERVKAIEDERIDKAGIEELRQRSEEAGIRAADEGEGDEGFSEAEANELIDTSFDFGANVIRVGDIVELDGKSGVVTRIRPDGNLTVYLEETMASGRKTSPRYSGFKIFDKAKATKVGTAPFPATLSKFYSKWGDKSADEITAEFTTLWDSLSADDKSRFAHRLRKFGITGAKSSSKADKLAESVASLITKSKDVPGKIREIYDIANEYPQITDSMTDESQSRLYAEMMRRIDDVGLSLPPMVRAAMVLPDMRRELLHNLAKEQFGEDIADSMFNEDATPEADPESFTLSRPKPPKPKAPDFGTNENTKQTALFDNGKKGELPGQNLLFNSDPGDLNNPNTQENKTPKPATPAAESDIKAAMRAELARQAAEEAAAKPTVTEKAPKTTLSPEDLAQLKADVEANSIGFMRALLQDKVLRVQGQLNEKGNTPKEVERFNAVLRKHQASLAALEQMEAPPKKPRTKTGQKLEKKSKDTGKAAKKAIDDFLKEMGDLGVLSGLGINNKALVATAKMVRAQIADGVVKFADFVTRFVENTSPETARKLSAYLEAAWEISGETDSRLDAVGKVADILGPEPQTDTETAWASIPGYFSEQLLKGETYKSITEARSEASDIVGHTIKPGTAEAKRLDELIEYGIVQAGRKIVADGGTPGSIFDKLVDLYKRQPTLGVRDSNSMEMQAYSTPVPLAYLVSQLGHVNKTTTVFEPTAGNGMLLIGTAIENAYANELDPDRAKTLRDQGFRVTENNAATMTSPRVQVVLANPPFGKTKDENRNTVEFTVDGYKTNEIDHAIALQSLKGMEPDGYTVLIIAAKGHNAKDQLERRQAYSRGKDRPFYDALYQGYDVTSHTTVDGSLYSRQGASFPVDVIVLRPLGTVRADKKRSTPWAIVPRIFTTWQEMKDAFNELADDGDGAGVLTGNGDSGSPDLSPRNQDDVGRLSGQNENPAAMAEGDVGPTESESVVSTPVVGKGKRGRGGKKSGGSRAESGLSGDAATERSGTVDVPTSSETNAGRQGVDSGTGSDRVAGTGTAESGDVAPESHQSSYAPSSKNKSVDTLIPTNLQDATQRALEVIEDTYGPVDTFVQKELGYKKGDKYFTDLSAEQVDALALAIHAHKNGGGMIVGDMTGVGKGRVAAAMMRYADRNGLVPVFVTEKPDLFGDMYRDLADVGSDTPETPFFALITNNASGAASIDLPNGRKLDTSKETNASRFNEGLSSLRDGNGFQAVIDGVPTKMNAVFTMYSQLQTVNGAETPRRQQLRDLMPNAYLILDESHNAGGTVKERVNEDAPPDRAAFTRELVQSGAGAMYLSATFAKRPDVMDLYSKTDMAKAVDGDVTKLAEVIKAGGLPLQQVVSAMLSERGQYIRREKSFEGVSFEKVDVGVNLEEQDKITDVFRGIRRLDAVVSKVVEEMAEELTSAGEAGFAGDVSTGDAGITSTSFSSILWNAVDQMLFALKSDKAADQAIQAWKNGEVPILAVDNTMESILDEYVKENNLKTGDVVNLSFKDILQRYLERSRWITIDTGMRTERNKKITRKERLTDDQLNVETELGNALTLFNDAAAQIAATEIDAPASPIDWLRHRMEKAGMKIAEITGRKSMLVYSDNNVARLGVRPRAEAGTKGKQETIRKINGGTLDGVILNRSGATGVSIHASAKFKNQKPRHMIIVQPAKNIDEFMQMLGRVNRTGQVVKPRYSLAMSDSPSELRPAAVLSKKLASLNASVTAKSKGAVGFDVTDVMNQVGGQIVSEYLFEHPELAQALEMDDVEPREDGSEAEVLEDIVRKATGRAAILPIEQQREFWDDITALYNARIEELDALNANPLVAKTLDLDAKTISSVNLFKGKPDEGPFAAPAEMERMDVRNPGKPMTPEQVTSRILEFYGVDTMDQRWGAEIKWVKDTVASMRQDMIQFRRDAVARFVNPDAVRARETVIDEQANKVENAINEFSPGTVVNLVAEGQPFVGVVVGFTRTGKSPNPVAPSRWMIEVAINDAAKKLTIPVSRSDGLSATSQSMDSVLDTFRTMQTQSREKRWMGTGNLMAAFAQLSLSNGKLVFYTDDQGNTNRGILMPRTFNAATFLEDKSVQFDNSAAVLQFFDRGGKRISSIDNNLTIVNDTNAIRLVSPRARSRGGKYTLNQGILAAAGGAQFVSVGNQMVLRSDSREQQRRILDAVLAVTPLKVPSGQDHALARDVVGIPDVGAPDTVAEPEPESELRKSAREAREAVDAQKAENDRQNKIIAAELRKTNLGSGAPISDELAKAVATRMIGAIRLGVKQFDAFIKELRANLAEADVTGLKPTLIRTWNAIREKHGLDEASDAGFDAAMTDTVDVDVEQAIEAVKGEPPIAETGDAAATPESAAAVAEPVSTYSTKNAFSAEARERLDMGERPPVTPQPREPSVTLAEEIGRTAAGRERIDLLIGELMATPRAVTPLENDLLNFRNAELGNKLDAALRKQIDSRKNGDSAQEAVAEREATVFRKQKQDLIEMVLEPIGTAAGRALQARKAVINQDYTLERLSLEYEAAYGEAPSTAKLAEMQKQIDDLNASIKELERQLAEESAKNEDLETRLKDAHDTAVQDTKPAAPPKKATVLERLAKEGKEQVESGFKKLSAMLGKVYSIEGAAADLTEALIEIATGYSKQGVVRLADFLNRVGKRMGPKAKEIQAELISAWNTVRGNSTMTEQEQITNKIDILDPDTIGRAARDLHRFVIERDGLDASAEGREAAVVAVHAILVDILPDITRDEVARAMSGIGIYSELNKDDIEVIRRDQKAQLLSLQQIEDWMKGIAPPATGQERPPVSDEQRLLRRMVNEAKKAAGLVTTTEGQLRSALDAAKRMARNRIADLTKAIESGTRIERSRRVLEDPSGELQTLQAERDALQKLYNEAFGKPELSDAQKLNRAEKALDRAISNLESDLKAGKLYDDAPKAPVTSPEIDAKRAALAALKASREEMRLQSGEAQARSDAAYERLLKQREADLAQRLADGDFAPPGKKPERTFTPEMLKTMQSIAKQRQELKKQSDAWVFENRHIVYKAYMKGPVAGAHMLRKLLTTLDQSLIGRQGWLLGLTHPKIYAKSARQAFASNPIQARSMFPTEQDLFNTQAALDADANWVRLEKIGKLAVTDVHGGINREEDSRFVPEWFDKVWGIGGSERAGSAFINTQRRLVFRNLVSKLSTKLDGKNASLSNADLRVIGNLVNVASGRGGIGKWTGALDALTLVFFSPRWWVSRLSWWVGQPVWHDSRWFGGDGASTEVRQMAAAEWAKQAAAQIAVMGVAVAGLTAAFGAGGDDEEWEYYVDPRSPNFGRIRIGNTRIDMTAGLGQHLSLMSRLATGTQVDRWETKDVDKADLVGKHLRGKLAPVPSAFWDYLEGQSIGGEKFGTKEWIRDHSLPLIFQEANTAIKEEGAFTGGLLSAWMFFGGTAQTYEARVKSRVDITNELRAMKKQGKSPEQIQATLNKHLAHMAGLEAKDHVRTANPEEAAALQTVIKGESSPELLAAIQKEKYDIILNASGRVSSDPKRIHDDKGFTGSDDASRRSARSLVKTMIPDVNEAIDLYEDAYRARNNSIYEKNGKMKAAVWAGRARIRSIYAAE